MINITSQKGFIHPPSLRWWQWLLGNRTQKITTSNGTAQTSNTPVKAGTNQYQNYQYDGSGKMLNDGVRNYTYDRIGRISRIQNGSVGVVNGYNALGQRVQKNVGTNKTFFVYDETGKLLSDGEREFIYLSNSPVAMISSQKPNEVLQIHTDNLATPRAVTNAKNEVLWRWEGEAFGDIKPSVEMVKMPLRFAGQYSDDEVGLYYNYFRFYNPATGRYVENDPIGLAGGLNRYGYVGGSPLLKVDPRGLVEWNGTIFSMVFPIAHYDILTLKTKCINGKEGYARVHGKPWFVGFGAALTITGGTVTLEDNLSEINPNVFNGVYKKFGAGIGLGLTYGVTALQVGGASNPLKSFKPSLGGGIYDVSIGAGAGQSVVVESKIKACECEL